MFNTRPTLHAGVFWISPGLLDSLGGTTLGGTTLGGTTLGGTTLGGTTLGGTTLGDTTLGDTTLGGGSVLHHNDCFFACCIRHLFNSRYGIKNISIFLHYKQN
jgi:hypothetical protein